MKLFQLLIFAFLPFFLFSQNLTQYDIYNNFKGKSEILMVKEEADRIKVYYTIEEKLDDGMIVNTFHAAIFDDEILHLDKGFGKHILDNRSFVGKKSYTMKQGKKTLGTLDDVITYDEAIAKYEDLAPLDRLDNYNRKLPDEYYTTQLNYGWRTEVTGIKGNKFVRKKEDEEAPKAREGRSVLSKLVDATVSLAGVEALYVDVEKVNLELKETYNGGQDKKNYWSVAHSASCQTSGDILAVNYQKKDSDKYHHFMNGEIVLFDYKGAVKTRNELKSELPYETKLKASHFNDTEDGNKELNYIALVARQVVEKKFNSDGNDKQYAVMAVDKNANVVYNYTYELPYEKRVILDTLITKDNQRTLLMGRCLRENGNFILESSPEGQKSFLFELEDVGNRNFHKLIEHKNETYLIYKGMELSSGLLGDIAIYKLVEGQDKLQPQMIKLNMNDKTAANIEVLANDDELLLVMKQRRKGIMDFKWEMGSPVFYRLVGDTFEELSVFEDNDVAINASSVLNDMTCFRTSTGYYMLTKGFVPHPEKKGKLLARNQLTKLEL